MTPVEVLILAALLPASLTAGFFFGRPLRRKLQVSSVRPPRPHWRRSPWSTNPAPVSGFRQRRRG